MGDRVLRSSVIAVLALGGLLTAAVSTSSPIAADCGMGPPGQYAAGYRGIAFIGTVMATEARPDLSTVLTVDIERPIMGVDTSTITIVSGIKGNCSYFWGDQLAVGDRFLLAYRPVPIRGVELPAGATYVDDALIYRPTTTGWRFARGLTLHPELFPERALTTDTLADILAYLRLDPPPTDASPSTSPDPAASASSAPAAPASPSNSPAVAGIPNIERPLTRDELLAVVADRDRTATVVADVTIVPPPPGMRMPVCPPRDARRTGCLLGFIETGQTGDLGLAVDATTSVAASLGSLPASGPMAFRMLDGGLRLLGRVEQPTDSYALPVTAEAVAAPDVVPVGALVVIDGWLGVLGWGVPCPAPPGALLRQGARSPFVRCPAGWITSDGDVPASELGSVAMVPDGFGIPVQSAAYESFAPDPGAAVAGARPPRRATYLLRHVANPEPSTGPATGWQVVGRLDPMVGGSESSIEASDPSSSSTPAA